MVTELAEVEICQSLRSARRAESWSSDDFSQALPLNCMYSALQPSIIISVLYFSCLYIVYYFLMLSDRQPSN